MQQSQTQQPAETRRPLSEPNPVTRRKYKRQVFWQITVPMVLFAAFCILLMVLGVLATVAGVSKVADIAMIWLLGPASLLAIINLVFLVLSIVGTGRVLGVLPSYFRIAQDALKKYKYQVFAIDEKLTQPIIGVKSASAKLKGLIDGVRRTRTPVK